MFEDIETHKKLSKWIIGTFTACILIYLGIRHISHVADAVMWLKDLLNPLLIGLILALFLNVPLGVIERHLFPKHPTSRKTKMRRPLAILLSFILVIGGNLAGPIGMLLGVPAAAATYALLKEATDKRETHLKTQEKEQMGNSHKQNIS